MFNTQFLAKANTFATNVVSCKKQVLLLLASYLIELRWIKLKNAEEVLILFTSSTLFFVYLVYSMRV